MSGFDGFDGFDEYARLYPATPPLLPPPDRTPMPRFTERWTAPISATAAALAPMARGTTVLFLRGYLGNTMPFNLRAPCRALLRLGFDARIAVTDTGGTVEANCARIQRALTREPCRERLILCGHSKGGLEALWLLGEQPALAARCAGVLLSQTTRGPSRVLESLLEHRHQGSLRGPHRRMAERLQRTGLAILGARPAARQLLGDELTRLLRIVDGTSRRYPVIQTASWSSIPTAWLDSFHQRLGEIRPGCAHDGQFYLEDMIWPGLPHILLPHLDHAQPAMGGHGFDHARYWQVLMSLLG